MNTHRLIPTVVSLTLMVILFLVSSVTTAAAEKSIVIAQGVDVSILDPHMSNDTPTSNVVDNIYDSLLRRDEKMELVPALAESYRQIDDLTWEFVCRDDVRFHNGEIFDASVAKFSLERVLNPELKSPQASRLRNVAAIEVVDKRTLRITTKVPYPLLPAQLGSIAMVPPKYVTQMGNESFSRLPVGTGPYRFEEWVKDERVKLRANPAYYLGAPRITEVTFRPIPETATRIAELKTRTVDVIVNVPPHQVESIDAIPGLAIRTAPSARIIFIVLTTTDGGPLANKKVRQALNYAVDKKAIIEALLGGYGEELATPIPPSAFGFEPELAAYPYDPKKAKQLLKEAGYAGGFEVVFESPSGRYLMDKEVAQAVDGFLQAVGVKTRFEILEWGVFVSKLYQHAGAPMMLLGMGSSTFDADSYLFSLLRTGQISSYYSDPELDSLLDQARVETNPDRRRELYSKAQAKVLADAAVIPLYQQVDIFGVRSNVAWVPRADERILAYEMDVIR